jgi:hypothetical protein
MPFVGDNFRVRLFMFALRWHSKCNLVASSSLNFINKGTINEHPWRVHVDECIELHCRRRRPPKKGVERARVCVCVRTGYANRNLHFARSGLDGLRRVAKMKHEAFFSGRKQQQFCRWTRSKAQRQRNVEHEITKQYQLIIA